MNKHTTFRRLLKEKDSDAVLYVIGIAVALIVGIAYFAFKLLGNHFTVFRILSNCVFWQMTGFYCPGCGGTRSFIYLIHGDIIKSIVYYPFVPYAVTVGLIFYISQTLRFISRGRIKGLHFGNCFIIIGILLIAGNWIIKNLLLGVFGITLMI